VEEVRVGSEDSADAAAGIGREEEDKRREIAGEALRDCLGLGAREAMKRE
jgi:hypothetical protein